MKRVKTILKSMAIAFLCLVLLTESVGVMVYSHYCAHKHDTQLSLSSIEACDIETTSTCCKPTPSCCNTPEKQDSISLDNPECCTNHNHFFKLTETGLFTTSIQTPKCQVIQLFNLFNTDFSQPLFAEFENPSSKNSRGIWHDAPPPLYGRQILIQNCTFKIAC